MALPEHCHKFLASSGHFADTSALTVIFFRAPTKHSCFDSIYFKVRTKHSGRAVTMDEVPSLESFQAISNGNCRYKKEI